MSQFKLIDRRKKRIAELEVALRKEQKKRKHVEKLLKSAKAVLSALSGDGSREG